MTRFLAWLVLVLVPLTASAQTSPNCIHLPNLACANGSQVATQTDTTVHRYSGTLTPIILDGTTNGTNAISLTLSGDPAASFTANIPAGAASSMVQAISCGAGTHVNAISATTGLPTCSADTGGTPAWDTITSPTTSNQALSMAAFTTTWTWGNATGAGVNMFTAKDTTSNTGTGYVVAINTAASSAAKPISITAGGTANGVEMTTTGLLQKIGTGGIAATTVATGGLATALVWNELCTASPCTLAGTPRTSDTLLAFWRTLKLRRVTACGGINEYTLSGTTLTLCDSTGIGTGADSVQVAYEK